MSEIAKEPCYVRTVKNRCRVCFTCVRKCPAKAIRILKRQAEVIPERCIGCGNCVRVCSQGAKQVVPTKDRVLALLSTGAPVAACLAPSFPAEFFDIDFRVLVGMIRELGFNQVVEVGFGADLVAERYRRLLSENVGKSYIGSTCPAVVGFVERYHPDLLSHLAPIVSPMVAMARVMRKFVDPNLRIVFIGPCIAKKVEAELGTEQRPHADVDAVITFRELRELFDEQSVHSERCVPSDFDPPHPGLGALFPVARGALQAARIHEDLLAGVVVAADGLTNFTCALGEMAAGNLETDLLELLSCTGCIAGTGMTSNETLFRRRARVAHFVKYRMGTLDPTRWQANVDRLAGLDLCTSFSNRDRRLPSIEEQRIETVLQRMGKKVREDELNCGACGYGTCREHAIAIERGLAESEMCLPFVIEEFQHSMKELSISHEQLTNAQEQLMHSERLASMGQLAAGVAHELNNPLGVVLMYTHLLLDETSEDGGMRGDLKLIAEQADRCKRIVADLLDFARENKALLQNSDIRKLVRRTLDGIAVPAGIELQTAFGHRAELCELDPDQMVQVLTNLITNAIAAMPDGGVVRVETAQTDDRVFFRVVDNGTGIPEDIRGKIFQPFFTTKKGGKGTGLGLAVTYGIVKMHRGDIKVHSNADPSQGPTGTTFEVSLPLRGARSGNTPGGDE